MEWKLFTQVVILMVLSVILFMAVTGNSKDKD